MRTCACSSKETCEGKVWGQGNIQWECLVQVKEGFCEEAILPELRSSGEWELSG